LAADLSALAGAAAEAHNALFVERNTIAAQMVRASIKRATDHRRALQVQRAVMMALLEIADEVPILGDADDALKSRAQAAREAPIAGVREQVKDFVLAKNAPEDAAVADAEVAKVKAQLAALLDDANVNVEEK
jgi:hypothetical protein